VDRLVSTWAPGNYGGATYAYDAFDNMRTNVLGQNATSPGRQLSYRYDNATNRLSALVRVNQSTAATFIHDARGNLTRGYFYDEFGTLFQTTDFEYDRANTLQRITGLAPTIGEQRYRYDAHGHRIDVHTAVGQFNEARHWPIYTRDGLLRGESRPATGVGAGPNDQYYYLGTQLIARRRGQSDKAWFLTNHVGSNVATTDLFGNEIETSRFAAYGERHSKVLERGPAYAGHFEDATGITYMKARYYSGFMGVFLAIDPVDVDPMTGGNFNRYAYANNNPFKYVDPDGRSATLAVQSFMAADVAVPEPTDAAWPKWVGYGVVLAGAVAVDAAMQSESTEPASAEDKALSPEGNVGASASPDAGVAEVSTETIERPAAGSDGARSSISIERDENGDAISRRHTVTKDGEVVHQHQEQLGRHGGERAFPDEWTGTPTINAEPKYRDPQINRIDRPR
jgi:RHS repeat-associated protein